MSTAPPAVNTRQLVSRITRDQGPELEQTLAFTALQQISTPTSLRTDRKIKWFYLTFRGRLTNSGSPGTYRTNTLLGTAMFSLIQQFTIRGQHLRYGAQTPIQMRGEFAVELMTIMNPNYVPTFSNSVNGGAIVNDQDLVNTASATQDISFTMPIPTFPFDISPSDQSFYCLHGPDWPGNLYIDILCADTTALGVTTVQSVISAYGSNAGSASVAIYSIRPLLGKNIASKIRPAVTFRVQNYQQPTQAVSQGSSASGVKLSDLTVGKDTTRIFLKAGTAQTGTSAGVTAYSSLSNGPITNAFISLDNRQLRFGQANSIGVLQAYMGLTYGKSVPVGYQMIDFISNPSGAANPKASFLSSQLTAARKFELDGDVVVTSTNIAEMVQEMILGRPAILAGQAASS